MKNKKILNFESFSKINEEDYQNWEKRTAEDIKRIEDIGKWDLSVDLKDTMSPDDRMFLNDLMQKKISLLSNGKEILSNINRIVSILNSYINDYETLNIVRHSSNFGLNKIFSFLVEKGYLEGPIADKIKKILQNTPKDIKDKDDAEWEERKSNQTDANAAWRRRETENTRNRHNILKKSNPDSWKDDLRGVDEEKYESLIIMGKNLSKFNVWLKINETSSQPENINSLADDLVDLGILETYYIVKFKSNDNWNDYAEDYAERYLSISKEQLINMSDDEKEATFKNKVLGDFIIWYEVINNVYSFKDLVESIWNNYSDYYSDHMFNSKSRYFNFYNGEYLAASGDSIKELLDIDSYEDTDISDIYLSAVDTGSGGDSRMLNGDEEWIFTTEPEIVIEDFKRLLNELTPERKIIRK